MLTSVLITAAALATHLAVAAAVLPQPAEPPQPSSPAFWPYREKLAMVQRNVLPQVLGRLDHFDFDPVSKRLYVAAIANGTLEVHHEPDSTRTDSIELPEPTDVLVLAESRRVVVSCAGDSSVRVFAINADGRPTPERRVSFTGSPGSLALVPGTSRVVVAHGTSVGSFDIATGELGPDTDVGGEVEGLVVSIAAGKARAFANVPSRKQVAVVDPQRAGLLATWSIAPADAEASASPVVREWNYALSLDDEHRRLFVATRMPAELVVLDAGTGSVVARVAGICADADDCWYDPVTQRVFISGGGGSVSLVRRDEADTYRLEATIKTASGARTSCFDGAGRRLYVASPALGDEQAYIFVYQIAPR